MSPHLCCTFNRKPQRRDECMCGCGYLNGGGQVAAAQCLLMLGSLFSMASLVDCAFVKVNEPIDFTLGENRTEIADTFGFITFERTKSSFRCYWYDDESSDSIDQLNNYFDVLGSDFQVSRIFGYIAAGGGWLQFLYSITFCCTSQTRNMRYALFCIISILLTTIQGMTLFVFKGEFCQENECLFERGAGFACGACGFYFFAGLMYLCMTDYPGALATHIDDEEEFRRMPPARSLTGEEVESSLEKEKSTSDDEEAVPQEDFADETQEDQLKVVPLVPSNGTESGDDAGLEIPEVQDEEKSHAPTDVDESAGKRDQKPRAPVVEEKLIEEEIFEEEIVEEKKMSFPRTAEDIADDISIVDYIFDDEDEEDASMAGNSNPVLPV